LREGSGNREKYRGHEPSVFADGGPGLLGCASALKRQEAGSHYE